MPIKTDALVLKENNQIGEADRIVTLLTRERGVVRASVRGARKIQSRNGSATRMLTYAALTLVEGRGDLYVVTEARPERVFWALKGVEGLALAQYFCELCLALAPREAPAEHALRLMLNSLHFLEQGTQDRRLLKALTEYRLLCDAGYAPAIRECRRCGKQEGDGRLLVREGTWLCDACAGRAEAVVLPTAARAVLQRWTEAPLEKCYAVRLSPDTLKAVSEAVQAYLLAQVNRGFQTLDFYKTLET